MKIRDTNGREVQQTEINMGSHKIINVTDPASDQDASTKKWTNDNFLNKENTTSFTPDADYEPATKKYVDDTTPTVNIKTGSYTGNGADARQITTGFECVYVIIMGETASYTQVTWVVASAGNLCWRPGTDPVNGASNAEPYLHASDGFVVGDEAQVEANTNTKSYYYIAFGAFT